MNPGNILLVEDDRNLAALLKFNLEADGYNVSLERDGLTALRYLESNLPDLIILDILLPRMTGWEFLEALRANESTSNIPVIVLTVRSEDASILRAWTQDVDCYLTKPFEMEELLAFVRRIVQTLNEREA